MTPLPSVTLASPTAASRTRRYTAEDLVTLGGLFLLGLVFRIAIRWVDRVNVTHDSVDTLIESQFPHVRIFIQDLVPPFYTYLVWCWSKLAGTGYVPATLLPLLFSALAVPALYVFAKYLLNRQLAILAALLLAVSAESTTLSGVIRAYSLLQLLTILAGYWFLRFLRERRAADWWKFIGVLVPMMYAHHYSAFVVATFGIVYLAQPREKRLPFRWIAAGATALLILYLPGLIYSARHLHAEAAFVYTYYRAYPGAWRPLATHWYSFFRTVVDFSNTLGPPWRSLEWVSWVASGLLFGIPLLLLGRAFLAKLSNRTLAPEDRDLMTLAGGLWLVPILAALGLGTLGAPYTDRYVFVSLAPYYVLVARGLLELKAGVLRWGLMLLVILHSSTELIVDNHDALSLFAKATQYVSQHREPGDCGVAVWFGSEPPLTLTLVAGSAAGVVLPQGPTPTPSLKLISAPDSNSHLLACERIWALGLSEWDGRSSRSFGDGPVFPMPYSRPADIAPGIDLMLYSRGGK
jgi:hypothetical protein